VIIDAHAHLVAPDSFYGYRAALLAGAGFFKGDPAITDDQLAESALKNLAVMDGVGTDVQLLSPRPYQQMHSAKPDQIVHWWIEANNDLIARTVALHPGRFAGVAGLPLCSGRPVETCLPEVDRAIGELGFVGVSLNPDPYEGTGFTPTLGDRFWYPLYEKLVELDAPMFVHPAGCCNGRESYSEHFITEESIAILSLLRSSVFEDFPGLKVIIAHGGGSVPYQIGRWQAERLHPLLGGHPDNVRFEISLRSLWFDTALHSRPSLELLFKVVGPDRCLFGTERPGSGSTINPDTGRFFDDIKGTIDEIDFLTAEERQAIYEDNARAVFSRLDLKPLDA
jgi:predicted TIM-barrel fold metal-dependent hydrolase